MAGQPDRQATLEPTRAKAPARVTTTAISFQGPLPPPEVLARYSNLIPNGAERIMAMAESQLQHRQSLESVVVKGNVRAETRGQVFAFALGLVAIAGGIWLIASGNSALGLASIITAFTALASVFVYGRIEQRRERERKRREAKEAERQPRLPYDSD